MARKPPVFDDSGREQLPGLFRPLESVPRGRSCVPRVGETHHRVAEVGTRRVTPPGLRLPGRSSGGSAGSNLSHPSTKSATILKRQCAAFFDRRSRAVISGAVTARSICPQSPETTG